MAGRIRRLDQGPERGAGEATRGFLLPSKGSSPSVPDRRLYFCLAEQFQFQMLKGRLGDTQIMVSGSIPARRLLLRPPRRQSEGFGFRSPLLFSIFIFLPQKGQPASSSFEDFREGLLNWQVEGRVEADGTVSKVSSIKNSRWRPRRLTKSCTSIPFNSKGREVTSGVKAGFRPQRKGSGLRSSPDLEHGSKSLYANYLFKGSRGKGGVTRGDFTSVRRNCRGRGKTSEDQRIPQRKSQLELANGAIERNNILSKIFSILNVSQVFEGRLPI